MVIKENRYQSNKLFGWLLIAIMSLSVCAFSGFLADSFSQYRQSTKVESLFTDGKQAETGTVSYQQLDELYHKSFLRLSNSWIVKIASYHYREATISLDINIKLLSKFEAPVYFLPLKINSSSSDQDESDLNVG